MIECYRCKAPSPEGKKFCGDCGAHLDPSLGPIRDKLIPEIRREVRRLVRAEVKDREVVEIKTAQAAASRILEWTKPIGAAFGILIAVLGLLGIKASIDISGLYSATKLELTAARKELGNEMARVRQQSDQEIKDIKADAGQEITKVRAQSDKTLKEIRTKEEEFDGQAEAIREKLATFKLALEEKLAQQKQQVDRRVTELASRFEELKGKNIQFEATPDVSLKTKESLSRALADFSDYMKKLTHRTGAQVRVSIRKGLTTKMGMISLFDTEGHEVAVDAAYAESPDYVLREYGLYLLSAEHPVDGPNEQMRCSGTATSYYAIKSGLGDYFACSFVERPTFGLLDDGQDLSKPGSLDDIKKRFFGLSDPAKFPRSQVSMMIGSEYWGGAFWDLRHRIGRDAADALLYEAWKATSPIDRDEDYAAAFARKVLELEKAKGNVRAEPIREVFKARGLKL